MPSQSRKHRGYEAQRIVAAYLRERGWMYAQPTGAGRAGADILGVLDLDIEVKARRGFDPLAALRQQADRADGRLPLAILRMDGQGAASIADWPVITRLGLLIPVLHAAGYGDPTSTTTTRSAP